MIKKYFDFINENNGVQLDSKVHQYFKNYKMKDFDENCLEIDISVEDSQLLVIRRLFPNYYVLYNSELKQMWIKDKPSEINLSDYYTGKYLYHDSRPEFREKILKEGLKLNSNLDSPLGYENLLFFYDIDTFESYDPREDKDIWIIDVKKNKFKWYENPNKNFDEGEGVYCLQQIVLPTYLKLKK